MSTPKTNESNADGHSDEMPILNRDTDVSLSRITQEMIAIHELTADQKQFDPRSEFQLPESSGNLPGQLRVDQAAKPEFTPVLQSTPKPASQLSAARLSNRFSAFCSRINPWWTAFSALLIVTLILLIGKELLQP